jgi:DNA-binding Xre family transcriptional regulator
MVRLRVAAHLKKRGWTAYRLAKEAGFSITLAYKLARPEGRFRRLDHDTLDRLCRAFKCQPGDLLEWRSGRT